MDTHAAFRELENGGFEARQAEALVSVISRSDSELVTKADMAAQKADIDAALTVLKADLKAEIAAMANKMIVGAFAVAGLLFAALKLWP